MEPLELVGLVASRMAHDFAGPVGALENGAALLADESDPAVRAEFTAMLGEAAGKLASMLRLYRLMFGAGNDRDEVPVSEARAALAGLLDTDGRVTLDWGVVGTSMARADAKLVLAMAVLGIEALPRGGALLVTGFRTVGSTGVRAALTGDTVASLTGQSTTASGSRTALAVFASALAARLGLALIVEQSADRVAITARPR